MVLEHMKDLRLDYIEDSKKLMTKDMEILIKNRIVILQF